MRLAAARPVLARAHRRPALRLLAAGALLLAGCSAASPPPRAAPVPAVTPSPVPTLAARTFAWRYGPRLPVAVSEVGVAALGTRVHVLGGYVGGRPHSTTHLVLDTRTGRWSRGVPLPEALDHVGV